MSLKEAEQVNVFEQLKRKEITQALAAQMLQISDRWVREKFIRYSDKGLQGLLHQNRGKASKSSFDKDDRERAIDLFREGNALFDFPPTHGAEKLAELYGIKISKETLRQLLIKAGLWVAGKKKPIYRKRRPRRACLGIMIQLDGSPHDWFEGRGEKCTLLVFIDDATSSLMWIEFAPSESLDAIMRATQNYFKKCGRPLSFYVDYGSVFSVNTNNPERDKITQFERAMKELGVEIIHARSPQAKGRVERVNRTLQGRLVRDLRLAGISSIEEANAFVQNGYLDKHNKQFAVVAEQPSNVHRSIDGIDINNVFCIKDERVLQLDFTLSYKGRQFQLLKQQKTIIKPRERIVVHEHFDASISLWIRKTKLIFHELEQRPVRIKDAVDYVRRNKELDQSMPVTIESFAITEQTSYQSLPL